MKKQSSYQKLKQEFEEAQKEFAQIKDGINNKKNTPISSTIPLIQTLYRIRTDISTWRNALQYAENIQYPVRLELYRLYAEVMLDAHLSSTIGIRKAYTLGAEYIVTKNGKEIPELSEKLKAKWFYNFINLALDSIYFGFSLIEFDAFNQFKEFNSIDLVPRQYVKPEYGIVGTTPSSLEGASYLEPPYSNWCIGVGERTNLGLLAKLAPLVLWKRGCEMAYAEYAEMFGTPIRILKTDSYDESTRQAGENFMRNMATSAYAVIGKEDDIQLISDKQANGVGAMFKGLISTMNEEMSKLIIGGTASMDEKSYVGSARIHQENFELIIQQDRIFIENIFKYHLVPFLNIHGFGLEGCKIETRPETDLTLLEQFQVDSQLIQLGFQIEPDYLNQKYGTQVSKMKTPDPQTGAGGSGTDDPDQIKTRPITPLIK